MNKIKSDTRANPQYVNRTYTELLKLLDLDLEHVRLLTKRGLTEEEIKTYCYRSLPFKKQETVASLIKKIGTVQGVPGFWKNGANWDLAGKSGILIPVRNPQGLITSLKIRVDKPKRASAKYVLLSSNPAGEQAFPLGTAARASVHWPLGRPRKCKALRITEGELKADLTNSLSDSGIYTVSLPGVKMWRMALDVVKELKPSEVRIAFDADKSEEKGGGYSNEDGEEDVETYQVGKACASLYLLLKEHAPSVGIEDWPKEDGKGIDDVLFNGAQDKIKFVTGAEADEWAAEMLRGDLPKDWHYIVGIKRFANITAPLVQLDKEQFNDQFRREIKGTPSTVVLTNAAFPLCDAPIYKPQQEPIIIEGRRKLFNNWRPNLNIIIDYKTKPQFYLDHHDYMYPDPVECGYIHDWLGWNFQHPGSKILYALVLQSKAGVGKSYTGATATMILGEHNVSFPSNDEIHEQYTHWAKNCSLVIIEELMARGRLDLMNRLKPIITQSTIRIREMNTPHYNQPNVFNVLVFTNYEDALIIDEFDRRYCIIYSNAEPKAIEYYTELWDRTRAEHGSIAGWYAKRDLSKFNSQARAPMTRWKEQLRYASMTPLQQWMKEYIETETWPFQSDIVATVHLHAKCQHRSIQNASLKQIGDALRATGCKPYPVNQGQIELNNGQRIRLWSVRRHEHWQSAATALWVAEYEKWSSSSEPGNPLWDSRPM
jgi:hypothetical protein